MSPDPGFIQEIKDFSKSDAIASLLDTLIEKYSDSWRNTDPEKAQTREHLYRMVQAVEGLKNEIRAINHDAIVSAWNHSLKTKF